MRNTLSDKKENFMKEKEKTFKCPECGGKVLSKTKYCVSCKKKVKEPKKENSVKDNIIEIKKEVKIGNVILEKGDKIKLLNEVSSYDNLSKSGIKKAISKLKKAKASLQKSLQKSVSSPSKSEQDLVMKMSNLIYKADNKGFKNDKEMEEWSEKYAQIKDEVQNWA